jgi:hypothetical protein
MKRSEPDIGDPIRLAYGKRTIVASFDLYQPEAKDGRYILDAEIGKVRVAITAKWTGEVWEEISDEKAKLVGQRGKQARREPRVPLSPCPIPVKHGERRRRVRTGHVGSTPTSSSNLKQECASGLSETREIIARSQEKPSILAEVATGSVGSNPTSCPDLKEVDMPPPGETQAIAPAAVTETNECPPPAPAPPAANHPFRQSFRPRPKPKAETAPASAGPYVVTRIPSGPTCEAAAVRTCRVCGCNDDDCSQCIAKIDMPCIWVSADLCSACRGFPGITHSSGASVRRADYAGAGH